MKNASFGIALLAVAVIFTSCEKENILPAHSPLVKVHEPEPLQDPADTISVTNTQRISQGQPPQRTTLKAEPKKTTAE